MCSTRWAESEKSFASTGMFHQSPEELEAIKEAQAQQQVTAIDMELAEEAQAAHDQAINEIEDMHETLMQTCSVETFMWHVDDG